MNTAYNIMKKTTSGLAGLVIATQIACTTPKTYQTWSGELDNKKINYSLTFEKDKITREQIRITNSDGAMLDCRYNSDKSIYAISMKNLPSGEWQKVSDKIDLENANNACQKYLPNARIELQNKQKIKFEKF